MILVILERCVDMPTEDTALALAKAAIDGAVREGVNKIYDAIGNVFPFWDAKRRAVGTFIDNIKQSNLSAEDQMMAIAGVKRTFKQLNNQMEIARIAQNTAKEGTDFSSSAEVDDEWLDRFMDSAKFVSDDTVQLVWGRVLANEFEEPNSTPPQVIRILSEITPKLAKIFAVLCCLEANITPLDADGSPISINQYIMVPNPTEINYLNNLGITFTSLSELEMIGLIKCDCAIGGYVLRYNSEKFPKIQISYGKDTTTAIKYPNYSFPIGVVLFTQSGKCLSRFIEKTIIDGHFDGLVSYLKTKKVKFSENQN